MKSKTNNKNSSIIIEEELVNPLLTTGTLEGPRDITPMTMETIDFSFDNGLGSNNNDSEKDTE